MIFLMTQEQHEAMKRRELWTKLWARGASIPWPEVEEVPIPKNAIGHRCGICSVCGVQVKRMQKYCDNHLIHRWLREERNRT